MKKITTLTLAGLVLFALAIPLKAQYTFQSGDNTLQISALTAVYYQYRFMKPGETSLKNDKFALRNLQLEVENRSGNNWEFKFKVDFAKVISGGGAAFDPENPGLSNAYVQYGGLPVKFKLGFDKLPYSQGSLNDVFSTPYWSRGILTSGAMFSRRDLGLTLSYPFWQQRINTYAGVYTGLGENIIYNGDTDPSGNLEYLGRIDVSYPTRYRYNEVDLVGVPIPMFRLGLNARYTDKSQPTAKNSLPSIDPTDSYGLRLVNGQKMITGVDFSAQYRCFSAQAEYHLISMKPKDPNDPLFGGTTSDFNNGKVQAGGLLTRVYYHAQKIKSTFSAQYENINVNSLVDGHQEWLSVAYAYNVKGWDSVFKIHYFRPLKEDYNSDPLKYTGQIRVGYQYQF